MTSFEIISLSIAGVALVISILSYRRATQSDKVSAEAVQKAENLAQQANALAMGNVELYMNERITHTKERVSDISLQMSPLLAKSSLTDDEENVKETFIHNFNLAIENNINAYEEACTKYLDGKVDRERFRRNYRREVRQLVEDTAHKNYFDGVTSPYKAILKVYDEWENQEK